MDNNLEDFAERSIKISQELGCQYCDVRSENRLSNGFVIENGEVEHSLAKTELGLGIRVLNDGAWGFYSISNPHNIEEIKSGVEKAVQAANYQSSTNRQKIKFSASNGNEGNFSSPVKIEPTIDDLIKIGYECDKIISEQKRIIKSLTSIGFKTIQKYFVNSEGSKIRQNYTDVVADLVATAHESGLTQTVNITEGGRGGIEKLTEKDCLTKSASFVSKKASELIDAKPAKEEKATVVMNPDFVALLTHEILGHPSEADRVLGKEMAWAGGAWWAGKLGEQIASEELNVFDDPTIEESLGWYKFDDEGNIAKRTPLIENGKLVNHMQSRETAETFHTKPSANMRATSYRFMPLIRMACTCVDKGSWDPGEMISEIKNGYLVSNMKIPSIDMKRYNWSISCQYAQKIENGEITDLLRDVIVLGTAPEFFKSIDACGNDFQVRPITNCGKGDPMQSMEMGNGGPSIRAKAIVKSVGKE